MHACMPAGSEAKVRLGKSVFHMEVAATCLFF
jgi:hypothetical protein